MPTGSTAILLLSCPDQRGLVVNIANFVFKNNGNITHADHHIDAELGLFLMRVEWELDGFGISQEQIASQFAPIAEQLKMNWSLHFSNRPKRIAIMVSRYNHCLYDLLLRGASGELPGAITMVISNHMDLEPAAKQFDVPFHYYPVDRDNKSKQEEKQLELLEQNKIDLVVLARYMQVLGPKLVSSMPNRIINIHHSFLPAFIGARPYHQAYERGVKLIGATSHYVTEQLDEGPIIEQDVVGVSHRDSVEDLVRKGRDLEKITLARAVLLHLEARVLPYGKKTVVFG